MGNHGSKLSILEKGFEVCFLNITLTNAFPAQPPSLPLQGGTQPSGYITVT